MDRGNDFASLYLCPARFVEGYRNRNLAVPAHQGDNSMSKTRLTERERQVLEMHENGDSRQDIARIFGITRGMVELTVNLAKRKLANVEGVALNRANDLLREVLLHGVCQCEHDDDCPCVRASTYLAAIDGAKATHHTKHPLAGPPIVTLADARKAIDGAKEGTC